MEPLSPVALRNPVKKRYSLNVIRAKRSYSVIEAAEALGVHIRTIQSWIKRGLHILDGSRPYLIMGHAVKSFLTAEAQKQRHQLGSGEFFCFRCRKAVVGSQIQTISTGKTMGRNKESVIFKGVCTTCGGKVNVFSTVEKSLNADVLQS